MITSASLSGGIQRVQDGGIWDDSRLTREEADARTKRKVEAVIKRERALAYAYSHQVRCRNTRNPFSSPPWTWTWNRKATALW